MGFIDALREKLELYKLEQRYTKRSKRTTFISSAQYVDGEYVYTGSPLTLKSSNSSGSGWMDEQTPSVRIKRVLKRQSAMF